MILPILTTLITAELSARDDFRQIGNDEKIRHVIQWCIRAAIVGAACIADWYWFNSPWYTVIGMAGLFSAFFRWRLNSLRGLDWRYVSPSSWYDWQFIRLTHAGYDGQRDDAIEWHGIRYNNLQLYPNDIHRAGLIAYIVEVVVFAVVLYCTHA